MRSKKIPNHEAKDGEIQKLKKRIKRLEKENTRLKSEVRTLEGFVKETKDYVDNKLDGVPVDSVIKGVNKKLKLKDIESNQIREACPMCITLELKSIPYRAGRILICGNCDYRKLINEESKDSI